MKEDFKLAIYESDGLTDVEKDALLNLYQEAVDPVTAVAIGLGVVIAGAVGMKGYESMLIAKAIDKYHVLHPDTIAFSELDEKTFPLKDYNSIPKESSIKHPKLYRFFRSSYLRVFYNNNMPICGIACKQDTTYRPPVPICTPMYAGIPMYGTNITMMPTPPDVKITTAYQSYSDTANAHPEYYNACALKKLGIRSAESLAFAKNILHS